MGEFNLEPPPVWQTGDSSPTGPRLRQVQRHFLSGKASQSKSRQVGSLDRAPGHDCLGRLSGAT